MALNAILNELPCSLVLCLMFNLSRLRFFLWKYNDYGIDCNFPFSDIFLPEPDNIREALQGVLGTWEHMDESATEQVGKNGQEQGAWKGETYGFCGVWHLAKEWKKYDLGAGSKGVILQWEPVAQNPCRAP